jgi:hypothetical protein
MGRGIRLSVGAFAVFVSLVLTAAPALAGTYQYNGKKTSVSSMKRGSKSAMCKQGRGLVGGGVIDDADASGQARVVSLQPVDRQRHDPDHVTDDGFKATVDNTGGTTLHMKTWAICAKRKVAKHLVYRSEDGASGSNDAIAPCPEGSRVVSGGGHIPGPFGEPALHASAPLDRPDTDLLPDDAWDYFVDVPGSSVPTAYVVCAKGKYAGGLHYVTADANIGPSFGSLKAHCDDGEHILGGGSGGSDLPILVFPSDEGPKHAANAWISHAAVPNSATPFEVTAICHH